MFRPAFIYSLTIGFLLMVALLFQWQVPINADNAWLLHLAEQVNAGKILYVEIFETNPPLIVWIHQLAAMLGALLGLNSEQTYELMIGALLVQAAYLIWRQNTLSLCERYAVMIGLLWVLPNCFGQREHLWMILALPYCLSLLPAQRPANGYMAALAAIGCCLKPYFPLIVFAAWAMRCWHRRSIRWLFALPQLLVMAVGGVYFIYLTVIDTRYLTELVPVLIQSYSAFSVPFLYLAELVALIGGYCFVPYLVMLWQSQAHGHDRKQIHLLFALSMAALLVLVLQQKAWANHWYPVCLLALVLNVRIAMAYFPAREVLPFLGKLVLCWAASLPIALTIQSMDMSYELLLPAADDPTTQRQHLLRGHSGETFFALSLDLPSAFPAVQTEGLTLVSPHNHLWFLPGFAAQGCSKPVALNALDEMLPIERKYFEQMVQAFVTSPPDWVVVGRKGGYTMCDQEVELDILAYYQQDAGFAQAWQQYELVETIAEDRYFRHVPK